MVRSGRNYKLYLKRCRYNYYKNLGLKLHDLKTKNSKQFWKIIDNKNNSNNVSANFDDLFEHFKNLNATDLDEFSLPNTQSNSNSIINNDFTEDEICNGIKKLKCNKACGIDNIANEFIIDSCNMIAPTITKLFNIILETGLITQKWCIGILTPIFKNKGSAENPENYRGISILSCFSKLFTLLINERLTLYLDDLGIIGENQAGFRSNYSTLDHIFSLKSIIDFYLNKRKKLFCAFVDYKKAFDTVNRNKLWLKVLSTGINGRIFTVIKNLYRDAKSCIKHPNGNISVPFQSMIGVRQGDNLSPLLFSLYLNDLELEMSKKYNGLSTLAKSIENDIDLDDIVIYLKIYTLLYADDTIILAESIDDLQSALNTLYDYCTEWDLMVNSNKTKILIFSRGKIKNIPIFKYGDQELDVVFEYNYLGIIFNYNGSFIKAKERLADQATKALFALIAKSRKLNLPLDIQLHLFDALVMPILLYGSEVIGHDNNYVLEKVHLKFCKMILHINKKTPTCMVLGELGRFPIEVYTRRIR